MAIIIPSKHIYSKSFDSVIDNNIDKIEINEIIPSTVYDYDTIVFNANYTDLGLYLPDNYDLKADNKSIHQDNTQGNWYYYAEAISFVNIRPAYTTVSIKIPKNQNGKLINKIYDKENIKYSLVLEEKTTVPISITVNISSNDGKPTNSNISYGEFNWEYDNRQTTRVSGVELKDYLSISNTVTVPEANATPVQGVTATASKTLSDQENLPSVIAEFNTQDNTWDLLNLKILTAVYINKAGESDYRKNSYPVILQQMRILNGTAEIYQAKQLSITIYGDTINLDLQEKTITINNNGNKIFSFDGNELIQDTNTPNTETKHQGVIGKWKNGKQTATITCPIVDYYDENGNTAINTTGIVYVKLLSKSGNMLSFQEIGTKSMKAGLTSIKLAGHNLVINVTQIFEDYSFFATLVNGNVSFLIVGAIYSTNRFIKQAKMVFCYGDIVIPYIYTNKGDKPLSHNKDFTPKQFKVIGTKISKRQGVQQELTLQEI